eukprot:160858-Alexandrium_andersonii.AAC.1
MSCHDDVHCSKAATGRRPKRLQRPTVITSCRVCSTRGRRSRGRRLAERAGGGGGAQGEVTEVWGQLLP